jgi:hypothetical protein
MRYELSLEKWGKAQTSFTGKSLIFYQILNGSDSGFDKELKKKLTNKQMQETGGAMEVFR